VEGGVLSLPDLINRMSTAPARAFHLPGGGLRIGAVADVCVLDVTEPWTVDPARFHSKSRNSPFGGRRVTGRARMTLVAGRIVHDTP